jgi:tetratricopeptide (TPR) repeat protein
MTVRAVGGAAVLVAMVGTAAVGCAHAPPAPAAAAPPAVADAAGDPGDRVSVVIDESAARGPAPVLASWTVYGVAVAAAARKTGRSGDYPGELAARAALAASWRRGRADGDARDPYLDALVAADDAGFLPEYVLSTLARPGWVVSGAELTRLKLDAFKAWAPGHLGKRREPETRATVRAAAGVSPAPVPGAAIPAPEEIDPRRTPCPALQPTLTRALGDWDAEAARLGQVPFSVGSAEHLPATLAFAARDARARRDGMVLVAPGVANLAFVAGFCEMERRAFADAEPFLRRAVALSPGNANIRGELVQSLIGQKRLDDADKELDVALAVAVDPCHVAMLWRKRGYILFDRAKLVDSYRAYARSLEDDPDSQVARREMKLIVSELQRAGGYDAKALEGYTPPPSGGLTVHVCK